MKLFEITCFGETEKVWIEITHYVKNGNLTLNLYTEDNEPFATLTTDLCDFESKSRACADVNNCPWARELIEKNGLGKFMGQVVRSGFCEYPVYEFDFNMLCRSALFLCLLHSFQNYEWVNSILPLRPRAR